jgi:hypothetical protein
MASIHLAYLLPPISLCAHAQDPRQEVAKTVASLRAMDSYVLAATDPKLGFAWYGEDPLMIAHGRELRLLNLGKGSAAQAIWQAQKGNGWALFSPSGSRLAEGKDLPSPEQVRQLMEHDGWRSLREGLRSYLRQHSNDGQAWVELACDIARLAREAKLANVLLKPFIEHLRGELLPCLTALGEVPGVEKWEESRPQLFLILFAALRVSDLDQDPEINQALTALWRILLGRISQDPEAERVWLAYSVSNRPEFQSSESWRSFSETLPGVPGRPWPPPFFSNWMRIWDPTRPEEMTSKGQSLLASNLTSDLVRRLGRAHVAKMLETWGGLELEGLLRQGRFEEAISLLRDIRSQAGQSWAKVGSALGEQVLKPQEGGNNPEAATFNSYLSKSQAESLRKVFSEPSLIDPPVPFAPRLELSLLGGEKERAAWGFLQIHELFDPWDSSEFAWKSLAKAEMNALRAKHDWSEEPRWVLMRGSQLIASGPGVPKAIQLDATLRTHVLPRLEALSAFIKTHPERLDARRERLDMLRSRIINQRLEALLVEDLEASDLPIGALPFKPYSAIWEPAAKRVCRRLSDHLHHWPFSESVWGAYTDWSAFDPEAQKPAALLASMETWPRQLANRLPGPLPASVSLSVIQSLQREGRLADVKAWMSVVWERGLKDWLIQWAALTPQATGADTDVYDRTTRQVKPLLAAWGQALNGQGDMRQLNSLRQELETIKPGLSAFLTSAP